MKSKAEKLIKICRQLKMRIHQSEEDTIIKRYDLRQLISYAIEVTDRHTICGWIDFLLAKYIIWQNPDSNLAENRSHKKLYPKYIIKPSNDTRYILNEDKINQILELTPTHRLKRNIQTKLFNKLAEASKGKNSTLSKTLLQ